MQIQWSPTFRICTKRPWSTAWNLGIEQPLTHCPSSVDCKPLIRRPCHDLSRSVYKSMSSDVNSLHDSVSSMPLLNDNSKFQRNKQWLVLVKTILQTASGMCYIDCSSVLFALHWQRLANLDWLLHYASEYLTKLLGVGVRANGSGWSLLIYYSSIYSRSSIMAFQENIYKYYGNSQAAKPSDKCCIMVVCFP